MSISAFRPQTQILLAVIVPLCCVVLGLILVLPPVSGLRTVREELETTQQTIEQKQRLIKDAEAACRKAAGAGRRYARGAGADRLSQAAVRADCRERRLAVGSAEHETAAGARATDSAEQQRWLRCCFTARERGRGAASRVAGHCWRDDRQPDD